MGHYQVSFRFIWKKKRKETERFRVDDQLKGEEGINWRELVAEITKLYGHDFRLYFFFPAQYMFVLLSQIVCVCSFLCLDTLPQQLSGRVPGIRATLTTFMVASKMANAMCLTFVIPQPI